MRPQDIPRPVPAMTTLNHTTRRVTAWFQMYEHVRPIYPRPRMVVGCSCQVFNMIKYLLQPNLAAQPYMYDVLLLRLAVPGNVFSKVCKNSIFLTKNTYPPYTRIPQLFSKVSL